MKKRRSGFTLIEVLVVVIIIGLLAGVSLSNFHRAQDKARIAALQSNLKNLATALELFAADNNGSYPDAATAMQFSSAPGGLLRNGYLGSNLFPKAPWGNFVQTNPIPVASPLVNASDVANHVAPPPPLNKRPTSVTGTGKLSTAANAFDLQTYGAVVYDYDAPTTTYVLYGIGKDTSSAMVSAYTTNGGGN